MDEVIPPLPSGLENECSTTIGTNFVSCSELRLVVSDGHGRRNGVIEHSQFPFDRSCLTMPRPADAGERIPFLGNSGGSLNEGLLVVHWYISITRDRSGVP